ncbi:MAG TPA: ferritin family protein [Planctomycetota bacterium]|nr:ferritin family protein [Planctomycetota bacterium]HUW35114.1 ferritin family protein [Planctomycetota bacterium]
MPDFANPFSGMAPDRKMTLAELTRAVRLNLAAEEEATHLYEAHADATDNVLAQKVLRDIAREERVHVGEFQHLLNLLLDDEKDTQAEGAAEVDEMAETGPPPESAPAGSTQEIPTVGQMR